VHFHEVYGPDPGGFDRRRTQRPVVVFSGTIKACERFFVKQTNKTVPLRNFFKSVHYQLVVVGGNVGRVENWSKLVLCGCDLIVFCFC